MTDITIGDPLEVQFFENRHGVIYELWLPATVASVSSGQFSVAFSDGQRLAIPLRGSFNIWRKP